MFASAKTIVLLAGLTGLLLWVGAMLDAGTGSNTFLTLMLVVSLLMNAVNYSSSDRIAGRLAGGQALGPMRYEDIIAIVERLAAKARETLPRLYLSPSPSLNAFATGRNPRYAAAIGTMTSNLAFAALGPAVRLQQRRWPEPAGRARGLDHRADRRTGDPGIDHAVTGVPGGPRRCGAHRQPARACQRARQARGRDR